MSKRRDIRRFQSSFRLRTLLSILVLVSIVLLVTLFEFFFLDDIYLSNTKRNLVSLSEEIAALDFSDDETKTLLSDLESMNNVYIEVYQPRNQLIYTSETNDAVFDPMTHGDNNVFKPRIMKILTHEETDEWSYFETRQEYFATAKYIVYGRTLPTDTAIVIYASIDTINANARDAFWVLFAAEMALLTFVLIVFILHFLTVSVPIDEITKVTTGIAQMDFNQVCPSFRLPELNELSNNINSLSASLDLTMRTLKRRNAQLEEDVEKEKEMLATHREFIANASHELKTPIAVIQGYAEGLKYGIYADNPGECYDIILDESKKMNDLVLELLEASRLSSAKAEPQYVPIALGEWVEKFFDQMKNIFIKNGITATTELAPDIVTFSDPVLLERVFSNFLSNAISHCGGKKQIRVFAERVDDQYRISVFNTGSPIAQADISNIWTSFYRADKAHSRKEGRFGLGLSIARSAQDLQGLKIGVVNHDDGVEFWFDQRCYNL